MILETRKTEGMAGRFRALALGGVAFMLIAGSAWAGRRIVQDRTITQEQAKAWVEVAARESAVPLELNELVFQQLSRYAGTPGGRAYLRESLEGMAPYRKMIEKKIDEYGLPRDLLAIPIHESGYKNLAPSNRHGAGLWSFIRPTAHRYGLKTGATAQEDERLDALRETDAAMRYLRDLHGLFKDWRLAFKAYNEGESRVSRLIALHGTRDAWTLERKAEGREGYLASVTAILILMKNPKALD